MPYYIESTGQTLPLDKAFSLNGVSYPATYLRLAPEDDIYGSGIAWRDAPERKFKDSRYYDNHVSPDGTVTSTPKDVEMLKANRVSEVKQTAGSLLAGSDWMVIAEMERERSVADDWAAYRTAVITECDRLEKEYTAATDIDELMAVKQNWPENPDEEAARVKREAEEEADNQETGTE